MKPLDGILVVDLARILAGPYCTMTLGDLGARVIKIEVPGRGDDTRGWGPPFWNEESAYFLAVNRNKESVTLDLKQEKGREILWQLIERADILVENFRPGTLARWGMDWETLHRRNPRLIYSAISGYGLDGPDRDRPGYDLIAQAEGGVMSLTGEPDGPPMKAGLSQADIVAGMWSTIGILAALQARQTSGAGLRVDTSLLEGQLGLLAYHAYNFWAGQDPVRLGNRHPNLTPYEAFAARDGYITVGVGSESLWRKFCEVLGDPALAAHPDYATNADRVRHRADLDRDLAPRFARHTVSEWLEKLGRAGIPCGKVQSVPEVLAHPHVLARDMVQPLAHSKIPDFRVIGLPIHFSEPGSGPRSAPPVLGEHTQSVLAELGYDDRSVAELERLGVV